MPCFSALCRIVSEFARLILFLASILFLLSSLVLLAFTYQSRRDFSYARVHEIDSGLTVLVGVSIYLIVLAILGIFASFFSSKSTIRLLACMLTLNVVVGVTLLSIWLPKFQNAHEKLESRFEEYLVKYDWDHRETQNDEIRNATRAWDNLQKDSHCCGLTSPDDWAQYRPKALSGDLLPFSCCQYEDEAELANMTGFYCNRKSEKYWTQGCSNEMKGAITAILFMVIGLVAFSMLLGIIASLVICCRPASSRYDDC